MNNFQKLVLRSLLKGEKFMLSCPRRFGWTRFARIAKRAERMLKGRNDITLREPQGWPLESASSIQERELWKREHTHEWGETKK